MKHLFFLLIIFSVLINCKSAPPLNEPEPAAGEPEIEVKEPAFTVSSITILQADLINTQLKLSLMIDNPNTFPITFSSFRYEFFGNGDLWSSGTQKNLAVVPAQGSSETSFEFEMNFIGMNRKLLDDIIAMRQVRYRVTGEVEIETGVASHPIFTMNFDYSGNSIVKQ